MKYLSLSYQENLSPASKMRVDRLADSVLEERDKAIALILAVIISVDDWCDTAQARWFGETLFQNLDIVTMLGVSDHLWDKYLELHPQLIDLEASLADDWFSPELMAALRSDSLSGSISGQRKLVAEQIKAQILAYLRGGSFNSRRLADIVNNIRLNEDNFMEWHNSSTAKLFAPPVFRNKKNSAGYFF